MGGSWPEDGGRSIGFPSSHQVVPRSDLRAQNYSDLFAAPGQHQGLLSAAKPGGTDFSTVLLLEMFITSTTFQIRPGIGNCEPFMEADSQQGWVFPAADVATSSGAWSTTPWPLNAQVGWSLTPGAEYLVFACSQHRFTNRPAVPLLITRDQVSGHWILAASPPSTSNGLRAVSWNVRSGQPSGSRTRWREPTSTTVQIRRPAELVIATTDWSDYESANEPAQSGSR